MNIRIWKNKIIQIDCVSFLTAWFYSFYICLLGVNSFFNRFIGHTSIDSAIMYGIYALLIIFSIIPICKRLAAKHFIFFMLMVLICAIGYLLQSNDVVFNDSINFLFTVAPFFFVGASIDRTDKLERYLEFFTFVACLGAALKICLSMLSNGMYVHDMTSAYSLLPTSIMAIYFAYNKKKLIYFFVMFVMAAGMLFFGVRGPIVLYLICLVILSLSYAKSVRSRTLIAICGILIGILIINNQQVLIWISAKLNELGIQNGAFDRLVAGEFLGDNGRNAISQKLIESILRRPTLGYGVFSDRVMLGNENYAHNLFLEMWLDFGVILGSIFPITFLVKSMNLMHKLRHDNFHFAFILSLFIMSFGQLMVSGSYLINEQFFLLIGIMMNKKFKYHIISHKRGQSR